MGREKKLAHPKMLIVAIGIKKDVQYRYMFAFHYN